jgi:hypothetical protein
LSTRKTDAHVICGPVAVAIGQAAIRKKETAGIQEDLYN